MTVADQVRTWAALASALIAVTAVVWSVVSHTRQLRGKRAEVLRHELLLAKTAAIDTWDLLRNENTLIHITAGITAELRDTLGKAGTGKDLFEALDNGPRRRRCVSLGWFRCPLSADLRSIRARLLATQGELTGQLRAVSSCAHFLVNIIENTHRIHAFAMIFDKIPEAVRTEPTFANAFAHDVDKAADWLADTVTTAACAQFFGEENLRTGNASPDIPSSYAAMWHAHKLLVTMVETLVAQPDRRLIGYTEAREQVHATYTDELRHHVEALRLDDEDRARLLTGLEKVESVLPKKRP